MYKFSKQSLENLTGVHPDLIDIVRDVMGLQIMDFSVREGLRDIETQRDYVKRGVSKTMNSKHLKQADGYAHAVDLYPYPVRDLNSKTEFARFGLLAGLMLSCAKANGVLLKWGADWDMDGETSDHSFTDAPHFEIVV